MSNTDTTIAQLISLGLSESDARAAAEALGDDAPSYLPALPNASPPAPTGYTPLVDDHLPAYEPTDAERARRAQLGREAFAQREQALRELYARYHAERRASVASVKVEDQEREVPSGVRGMGRRMSDAVKNAESSWTKKSAKYYMPMLSRWGTR